MSKTIIDSLITELGFDLDQGGFREAKRAFSDLHFAALDLVRVVQSIGFAIAKPLLDVVDFGTRTKRAAESLGIAAQGFQELQLAATAAGVTTADLELHLYHLGKSAYEAAHGNLKMAEAFRAAKIDLRNTDGSVKSIDALFLDMIDKLNKIPDAGARAFAAIKIMGRGTASLIPLLNMGTEKFNEFLEVARNSGATLNDTQLAAMERLNFSFKMLSTNTLGLSRMFGMFLVPLTQKVADTVNAWYAANRALIGQKVDEFAKGLTTVVYWLGQFMTGLTMGVLDAVKAFGGWANVLEVVGGLLTVFGTILIGKTVIAIAEYIASMTLATLTTSLWAFALGAAVIALLLIIDDLESSDGIIKDFLTMGNKPGESPLRTELVAITDAVRALWTSLKELGSVGTVVLSQFGLGKWLLSRGEAAHEDAKQEQDDKFNKTQNDIIDRRADESERGLDSNKLADERLRSRNADNHPQWFQGQGALPELTVQQTLVFNGSADPYVVKEAARAGVQNATVPFRQHGGRSTLDGVGALPRVGPR